MSNFAQLYFNVQMMNYKQYIQFILSLIVYDIFLHIHVSLTPLNSASRSLSPYLSPISPSSSMQKAIHHHMSNLQTILTCGDVGITRGLAGHDCGDVVCVVIVMVLQSYTYILTSVLKCSSQTCVHNQRIIVFIIVVVKFIIVTVTFNIVTVTFNIVAVTFNMVVVTFNIVTASFSAGSYVYCSYSYIYYITVSFSVCTVTIIIVVQLRL